jgi:hypothetical protein
MKQLLLLSAIIAYIYAWITLVRSEDVDSMAIWIGLHIFMIIIILPVIFFFNLI